MYSQILLRFPGLRLIFQDVPFKTGRRNAAQQNLYRNKGNQARTTKFSATAGNRAQAKATTNRDNIPVVWNKIGKILRTCYR
jgi:hypothetical protein